MITLDLLGYIYWIRFIVLFLTGGCVCTIPSSFVYSGLIPMCEYGGKFRV